LFKAVVRENISGGFSQWNAEFEAFGGSTSDMLRHCMTLWWRRQGNTKVSGITKLMLSEGRTFPELALFYQKEVIQPAHLLIARILQRGVDRGEFAPLNMKYAVFTVLAPMIFLQLLMHSHTACYDPAEQTELVPEEYLANQLHVILAGLCLRPAAPVANKGNLSI
jgi:hypothetical protein